MTAGISFIFYYTSLLDNVKSIVRVFQLYVKYQRLKCNFVNTNVIEKRQKCTLMRRDHKVEICPKCFSDIRITVIEFDKNNLSFFL